MRLKEDDLVEVIAGNDKGVRGRIMRVILGKKRVVVNGVNMVKRHEKSRPTGGRAPTQGGIIEFEAPIDVSNVMLVCPHTQQPTRIGIRRDEEGRPVRYSKRSGEDID